MTGPDAPPPRRPGGWSPRPWVLAMLALVSVVSGAFRLVLGGTFFEKGFGVLLIALGATWARDFVRARAAGPTGGGRG